MHLQGAMRSFDEAADAAGMADIMLDGIRMSVALNFVGISDPSSEGFPGDPVKADG